MKYSVLRLALFVGSLILLWAVGVRRSLLMLVLAAGISLALSYLLLGKQRNELALAIAERTSARLDRHAGVGQADADAEDAILDQAVPVSEGQAAPRSEAQADGQQQRVDE